MNRVIIGIFHQPWASDYAPCRSLVALYRRAVWLKANPRDELYMKALFHERYPQGTFINADTEETWRTGLALADTVVMLYPDATGLHCSRLESAVKEEKKMWATVRVLNGRRRDFLWNPHVRRRLRLRRFLERTMLGECFAIIAFLVLTPMFVTYDLLRGRQ